MKRVFAVVTLYVIFAGAAEGTVRIEREVLAAESDCVRLQEELKDRCFLTDYVGEVRTVAGTNLWSAALQKALREHEIVLIPPQKDPYFMDATVIVPSGRRIEAHGATVRLADGVVTVLLRNAAAQDGTLRPILPGARDDNIAVVGGRWEDNSAFRRGYGRSGRFNLETRRIGNFYGVSTLFYFGNANHVSVRNATFASCGGFAVQAGDGDAHAYTDIRFDDCFADGLHLNGNLTRVHVQNVRGKVGDDLVALNAYDWMNSSVNFGPQRFILCEDLELVLKGGKGYPAIRLQPATFKYADGSKVDCAISDVIFRRVKGIQTFKMYLQTPSYAIGSEPEWSEIGSGGNLFFEDIDIDLKGPLDLLPGYVDSDPVRGHYGAFEFGANLSAVTFRNVRIRFHLDQYPLGHLATVGPRSSVLPAKGGGQRSEVFDPYVSCTVDHVAIEGLKVEGREPDELIYSVSFDDINKDGHSTGRGTVRLLTTANSQKDAETKSDAYGELWNACVNAEIDARIEKCRKADASLNGFPAGTEVSVEQISHEFKFGSHIFNFNQLGRDDWNARYAAVFTNLWNAATVAFYWKDYEPVEGEVRFADGSCDGAAFWNAHAGLSSREKAELTPVWRRPAPDSVVAFCRANGISVHGHTIVYGGWQPDWTTNLPPDRLTAAIDHRIRQLADHYADAVSQWDVVNESVNDNRPADFGKWGVRAPFPADYTYDSFVSAARHFPQNVRLAINDAGVIRKPYVPFVRDLIRRGAKVDIVGVQMHIFSREEVLKVARGEPCLPNMTDWAPQDQLAAFAMLDTLGRPLHISEVTIPASDDSPDGLALQARIARDNYRLWFSWPSVERITWWNMVDYTYHKESLPSGLFTRAMKPKPVYWALDRLINHEWKTRLAVRANEDGRVSFRGFKGRYRLAWTDADGKRQSKIVELK